MARLGYPTAVGSRMLAGVVSLVIIVEATAGKAAVFLKYFAEEAADVVANEPGCVQFCVSRAKDNDHLFTLAEF